MNFKKTFHYISYVQYPLMILAVFFIIKPFFYGIEPLKENPKLYFESLNSVLLFMGLATSFSSLQDSSKTQNEFSKKIWENPLKGKIMIFLMCFMIMGLLTVGLIGFFNTSESMLKELSVGLIVFSLGMFGFLKTAIELFENHRLDKKESEDVEILT